jgi:protein ImuB
LKDASATDVVIRLADPARELNHLQLLLQERLAKVQLERSVVELSLHAQDVVALSAPNTELFPAPAAQSESIAKLVERLASRLGEDAVHRLRIAGDHRPERCSVAVSAYVALKSRLQRARAKEFRFPPRPAWLLQEPLPLLVRRDRPFYQSALILLAGPERIEAGWWDDALVMRDYYIACNEAHLLLWVYQERRSAHCPEPGWFLHGFFG